MQVHFTFCILILQTELIDNVFIYMPSFILKISWEQDSYVKQFLTEYNCIVLIGRSNLKIRKLIFEQ